jgi:hypothetical protein
MGGWDKDDVETSQTTWPVGSSIKFRICYTTKERDTYRKYCPFSLCFYSNSYNNVLTFPTTTIAHIHNKDSLTGWQGLIGSKTMA